MRRRLRAVNGRRRRRSKSRGRLTRTTTTRPSTPPVVRAAAPDEDGMAPYKRGGGARHVPMPGVVELRPLPSSPRPCRVVGERRSIVRPHPRLALQGEEADRVRLRRRAVGSRGRRDTLPLGDVKRGRRT